MTPDEKAQLDANTRAVASLSSAILPLADAVGRLATVAAHQSELVGLRVLVPVCGALFAEIANGSANPGHRLDEMLTGLDGRLSKALDQINAPDEVRDQVHKIADELIGLAEVMVHRG